MIVVCGEALFDVFPEQQTRTGLQLSARIGGSPFNLAVGLARLGVPPLFFGGLSNDLFGQRLASALTEEQVDISAAPRLDAQSALVMVSVDNRGVPAYGFYGTGTAERSLVEADIARVPKNAGVIHVGSYCMVCKPVANALRALVERQQGQSVIVYDPNIRLSIEPSVSLWRETLEWMLPRTGVLKVSDEDLNYLYPGQSAEDFIAVALRAGVQLVVVTRGSAGALAATAHGVRAVISAVPVRVVDTVGAGDTFQAGLLSWLWRKGFLQKDGLRGLDIKALETALRFAACAAAITCSRRGADLPHLSEVIFD
ncbi:carbohydrate kinase [Massilia terrae]|uniref:Carbohydrate kinase n=1 Tax=Massilia terrae TaxID=1811224 RepID=A0ABT2D3A7_9BURK|nr:carbohydrate kinase [Massilia terrae]MCS0660261.1 carbohydrate kinase [Massilia terrae]